MNLRRATAIFVFATLTGGGALFLALRPGPVPIRAEGAVAVPLADDRGALRVFVTLHNDGSADRLIGAETPVAGSVLVIGAGDIPVPTGSAPVLAADGAHLRLAGVAADLGDGAVLPLTLLFASGARVATRAVLSDPMARGAAGDLGLLSLGDICRVGEGEPAPRVAVSVTPEGGGWQVQVAAQDFTFTEPLEGMGHIPGYGHGHLYLNGVKLQRMYGPDARVGSLMPGDYRFEVTLNTNDHRAYVVGDTPVTASVSVRVP